MSVIVSILFFGIGLLLIVKGGSLFADAARWVGEAAGIPKIIVGATVISLATTVPELLVSSVAAYENFYGIATGSAIGSVLVNLGLGLGIALFAAPGKIKIKAKFFYEKTLVLFVIALTLWLFFLDAALTFYEAAVLICEFALFLYFRLHTFANAAESDEERPFFTRRELGVNSFFFAAGAVGVVCGAKLLVDNGILIARFFGISESVFGLTVIAAAASLPELSAAVTYALKKETSLSIGNVLGAAAIDMAVVLPVCSFISGGRLYLLASNAFVDLPFAICMIAAAFVPALITRRFFKAQGVLLIAIYVGYFVITFYF